VQELAGNTPKANLPTGGLDETFSRTDSAGARHLLKTPNVMTDSTQPRCGLTRDRSKAFEGQTGLSVSMQARMEQVRHVAVRGKERRHGPEYPSQPGLSFVCGVHKRLSGRRAADVEDLLPQHAAGRDVVDPLAVGSWVDRQGNALQSIAVRCHDARAKVAHERLVPPAFRVDVGPQAPVRCGIGGIGIGVPVHLKEPLDDRLLLAVDLGEQFVGVRRAGHARRKPGKRTQ